MASYSVADAKNNLSQLIDRALKGEGVVINCERLFLASATL